MGFGLLLRICCVCSLPRMVSLPWVSVEILRVVERLHMMYYPPSHGRLLPKDMRYAHRGGGFILCCLMIGSAPLYWLIEKDIIVKRKRDFDVPFCYRLEYNIENGHERNCLDIIGKRYTSYQG